jgi:hypothetical protein
MISLNPKVTGPYSRAALHVQWLGEAWSVAHSHGADPWGTTAVRPKRLLSWLRRAVRGLGHQSGMASDERTA